MKIPVLAVSVIFVLTLTACSFSVSPNVGNLGWRNPDSGASSEPLETASPDLCDLSTREAIELFDAVLDRIDRVSNVAELPDLEGLLYDLFFQAGENIGVNCGAERAGLATSELVVWASRAASTRLPQSALYAEGFLGSICEIDVQLTPLAKDACAG